MFECRWGLDRDQVSKWHSGLGASASRRWADRFSDVTWQDEAIRPRHAEARVGGLISASTSRGPKWCVIGAKATSARLPSRRRPLPGRTRQPSNSGHARGVGLESSCYRHRVARRSPSLPCMPQALVSWSRLRQIDICNSQKSAYDQAALADLSVHRRFH